MAIAVLGISAAAPGAARADRIAEFEACMSYDSNLNNARFRDEMLGDLAVALGTSQGWVSQINASDSVTLTGDLRGEAFQRYRGMDNLSLGVTAGYRRKIGMGALAPWLAASLSAARLNFQNAVRNGWLYTGAVRAGKRIDEQFDVSAEYRFERRTGDSAVPEVPGISGAVFDLRSHNLALNAGYAWNDKTLLSMGYAYRTGDVVSTSLPNAAIFLASSAIAEDPVFRDGMYAYRLHASTHVLSLRLSRAIDGDSSVNLGMQRQLSHGDGGNNYAKSVFELSYLRSF